MLRRPQQRSLVPVGVRIPLVWLLFWLVLLLPENYHHRDSTTGGGILFLVHGQSVAENNGTATAGGTEESVLLYVKLEYSLDLDGDAAVDSDSITVSEIQELICQTDKFFTKYLENQTIFSVESSQGSNIDFTYNSSSSTTTTYYPIQVSFLSNITTTTKNYSAAAMMEAFQQIKMPDIMDYIENYVWATTATTTDNSIFQSVDAVNFTTIEPYNSTIHDVNLGSIDGAGNCSSLLLQPGPNTNATNNTTTSTNATKTMVAISIDYIFGFTYLNDPIQEEMIVLICQTNQFFTDTLQNYTNNNSSSSSIQWQSIIVDWGWFEEQLYFEQPQEDDDLYNNNNNNNNNNQRQLSDPLDLRVNFIANATFVNNGTSVPSRVILDAISSTSRISTTYLEEYVWNDQVPTTTATQPGGAGGTSSCGSSDPRPFFNCVQHVSFSNVKALSSTQQEDIEDFDGYYYAPQSSIGQLMYDGVICPAPPSSYPPPFSDYPTISPPSPSQTYSSPSPSTFISETATTSPPTLFVATQQQQQPQVTQSPTTYPGGTLIKIEFIVANKEPNTKPYQELQSSWSIFVQVIIENWNNNIQRNRKKERRRGRRNLNSNINNKNSGNNNNRINKRLLQWPELHPRQQHNLQGEGNHQKQQQKQPPRQLQQEEISLVPSSAIILKKMIEEECQIYYFSNRNEADSYSQATCHRVYGQYEVAPTFSFSVVAEEYVADLQQETEQAINDGAFQSILIRQDPTTPLLIVGTPSSLETQEEDSNNNSGGSGGGLPGWAIFLIILGILICCCCCAPAIVYFLTSKGNQSPPDQLDMMGDYHHYQKQNNNHDDNDNESNRTALLPIGTSVNNNRNGEDKVGGGGGSLVGIGEKEPKEWIDPLDSANIGRDDDGIINFDEEHGGGGVEGWDDELVLTGDDNIYSDDDCKEQIASLGASNAFAIESERLLLEPTTTSSISPPDTIGKEEEEEKEEAEAEEPFPEFELGRAGTIELDEDLAASIGNGEYAQEAQRSLLERGIKEDLGPPIDVATEYDNNQEGKEEGNGTESDLLKFGGDGEGGEYETEVSLHEGVAASVGSSEKAQEWQRMLLEPFVVEGGASSEDHKDDTDFGTSQAVILDPTVTDATVDQNDSAAAEPVDEEAIEEIESVDEQQGEDEDYDEELINEHETNTLNLEHAENTNRLAHLATTTNQSAPAEDEEEEEGWEGEEEDDGCEVEQTMRLPEKLEASSSHDSTEEAETETETESDRSGAGTASSIGAKMMMMTAPDRDSPMESGQLLLEEKRSSDTSSSLGPGSGSLQDTRESWFSEMSEGGWESAGDSSSAEEDWN